MIKMRFFEENCSAFSKVYFYGRGAAEANYSTFSTVHFYGRGAAEANYSALSKIHFYGLGANHMVRPSKEEIAKGRDEDR